MNATATQVNQANQPPALVTLETLLATERAYNDIVRNLTNRAYPHQLSESEKYVIEVAARNLFEARAGYRELQKLMRVDHERDAKRIQAVALTLGLQISLHEAERIWSEWSERALAPAGLTSGTRTRYARRFS